MLDKMEIIIYVFNSVYANEEFNYLFLHSRYYLPKTVKEKLILFIKSLFIFIRYNHYDS